MEPVVLVVLLTVSLTLGIAAARGVLGLIFQLMVLARPHTDVGQVAHSEPPRL